MAGAVAQNSKLRTFVVNVRGGTYQNGSLYGVYVDGTGSDVTTQTSLNTMRAGTVQVNGTTGSTLIRGIQNNGNNRISFRECNIYATEAGGTAGSTRTIGLETGISGAFIESRTSTISGTGNDINQGVTGSTILLGLSDLANKTATNLGFFASTQLTNLAFTVLTPTGGSPPGVTTINTTPGTYLWQTGNQGPSNVVTKIALNQPTLIQSISLTTVTAIAGGVTFTIDKYTGATNTGSLYIYNNITGTTSQSSHTLYLGATDTYAASFRADYPNSANIVGSITLF
jgi:hypothetical protein